MKSSSRAGVDDEKLISFARTYLPEAFPNPDRTGCPPEEAIRRLAEQATESNLIILDHLGCCSACFQQYQEILGTLRARKKADAHRTSTLPFFRLLVYAAGMLAILAALVFMSLRKHGGPSAQSHLPTITAPKQRISYAVVSYRPVILDMSAATQARDAGTVRNGRSSARLPRAPLHITAYLPLGSASGAYHVCLMQTNRRIWLTTALANMRDERMTVEFDADLTVHSAGRYDLALIGSDGLRIIQSVMVEDEKRGN